VFVRGIRLSPSRNWRWLNGTSDDYLGWTETPLYAHPSARIKDDKDRENPVEGVQSTADAWRPIEEAPKDGTVIDVWRDGSRETVYWGFPPHCCGEMGQYCDSDWHSLKKPGWICSTFGEYVGGKHDPFSHFMPLPAPPAKQSLTSEGEG